MHECRTCCKGTCRVTTPTRVTNLPSVACTGYTVGQNHLPTFTLLAPCCTSNPPIHPSIAFNHLHVHHHYHRLRTPLRIKIKATHYSSTLIYGCFQPKIPQARWRTNTTNTARRSSRYVVSDCSFIYFLLHCYVFFRLFLLLSLVRRCRASAISPLARQCLERAGIGYNVRAQASLWW